MLCIEPSKVAVLIELAKLSQKVSGCYRCPPLVRHTGRKRDDRLQIGGTSSRKTILSNSTRSSTHGTTRGTGRVTGLETAKRPTMPRKKRQKPFCPPLIVAFTPSPNLDTRRQSAVRNRPDLCSQVLERFFRVVVIIKSISRL